MNRNGSAVFAVLLVVGILLVVAGGIWLYEAHKISPSEVATTTSSSMATTSPDEGINTSATTTISSTTQRNISSQGTVIASTSLVMGSTTGWEAYTNNEYGFSLQYPTAIFTQVATSDFPAMLLVGTSTEGNLNVGIEVGPPNLSQLEETAVNGVTTSTVGGELAYQFELENGPSYTNTFIYVSLASNTLEIALTPATFSPSIIQSILATIQFFPEAPEVGTPMSLADIKSQILPPGLPWVSTQDPSSTRIWVTTPTAGQYPVQVEGQAWKLSLSASSTENIPPNYWDSLEWNYSLRIGPTNSGGGLYLTSSTWFMADSAWGPSNITGYLFTDSPVLSSSSVVEDLYMEQGGLDAQGNGCDEFDDPSLNTDSPPCVTFVTYVLWTDPMTVAQLLESPAAQP